MKHLYFESKICSFCQQNTNDIRQLKNMNNMVGKNKLNQSNAETQLFLFYL